LFEPSGRRQILHAQEHPVPATAIGQQPQGQREQLAAAGLQLMFATEQGPGFDGSSQQRGQLGVFLAPPKLGVGQAEQAIASPARQRRIRRVGIETAGMGQKNRPEPCM
jgi:hypothetical protein